MTGKSIKIKNLTGVICLAILIGVFYFFNNKILFKNPNTAEWIEDIEYMQERLPKRKVELYHDITKQEFDKQIQDLKDDVPKLKDYEIEWRLSKIVALIGEAHTKLYNLQDNNRYPFIVKWFENDLRVTAAEPENKQILGKKLISINNIDINKIISKINEYMSYENNQWAKVNNSNQINNTNLLKTINVTKENECEFKFKDDSGKIIDLKLMPQKVINKNMEYLENMIEFKNAVIPDKDEKYNDFYWYKYMPNEKILYFQYNICGDKTTPEIFKKTGIHNSDDLPDFEEFSDRLIDTINKNEINKFIIDLRNNGGGNSKFMSELSTKLASIKKINKRGKIFVIIGKNTFSSGVFACTDLKAKLPSIFYGESTGGNVNHYGDVAAFMLPNSKLFVVYSTKYFEFSNKYKEGFTPDVIVKQTFENYINGIDSCYKAIIEFEGSSEQIDSKTYQSKEFGLSVTFPKEWIGKYRIKENNEGIFVYFKAKEKLNENEGLYFCILKKTDNLNEDMYDSIDGKKEIKIKQKSYFLGGPTGLSLPESNSEFDTFIKLQKQVPDIVKSIKEL